MTAESRSRSATCPGPYTPYRAPWLPLAAALFGLVYWLFGLTIENVDLQGPVAWLAVISSRLPGGASLGNIESPALRIILNLVSPIALLHLAIPAFIGYLLANRTATAFLQNFYNFASRAEADSFLARLQATEGLGVTTATSTPRRRSSFPTTPVTMLAAVLFFAMLALFVAIADYLQGPEAASSTYYLFLIVLLVLLWILFLGLVLLLTKEYLDTTQPDNPRLAQIAGQRILAYFFVLVVLVLVPLFFMALIWQFLSSGDFTATGVLVLLLFGGISLLITVGLLSLMRPAPRGGIVAKRDELPELRQQHALLRVGGPGGFAVEGPSSVAITERNGRFCRVLGPGGHRLGAYEYLQDILDLRQHDREGSKEFVTKDGIRVTINVGVTFRIALDDVLLRDPFEVDTEEQLTMTRPTRDALYPFGQAAAREAAYTRTVLDDDGDRVSNWTSLPLVMAQSHVGKIVALLRYDELFAPDEPERWFTELVTPRERTRRTLPPTPDPDSPLTAPHPLISDLVRERTQGDLRSRGVQLLHVRLGAVRPVAGSVLEEHIETWQAAWEKQAQLQHARGEAEMITEIASARSDAERVMIQAIAEGITLAEREYGVQVTRRLVALRVVETLSEMVRQYQQVVPGTGQYLLRELNELQEELDEDNEGNSGNPSSGGPTSSTTEEL